MESMETRRRSMVKALSWRVFATFITTGIAYALTGQISFAIEIGLIDTLLKLLVYFAHERVWQRSPYGLPKKTDYAI